MAHNPSAAAAQETDVAAPTFTVPFDTRLLCIGGIWRAAAGGETLALTNPSDGSDLAHIARGGTADIAINASMPNALTSRDRVSERVEADPALAALMTSFLGCAAPLPDPIYPKR